MSSGQYKGEPRPNKCTVCMHQLPESSLEQQSIPMQATRSKTKKEEQSSSAKPKAKVYHTDLINGEYRVGRKIGAGSYGQIRVAYHIKTNKKVAVKLEALKHGNQLQWEYQLLQKLSGKPGFAEVYYYGTFRNTFHCLVMLMLGNNLESVFDLCKRKFTIKSLVFLVTQLIRRFETIHSLNIVYRDVKPENFLLGEGSNRVHVIDYGLSKYFLDENGEHVKERQTREIIGTSRYMSVSAHLCREQSRRDDMESLAYVMVYFMRAVLPWSGLKMPSFSAHNLRIMEIKRDTPAEQLCAGYPQEFLDFYNYARKLDFKEEPRYEQMINMFKKIYSHYKIKNDGIYDWNPLLSQIESQAH